VKTLSQANLGLYPQQELPENKRKKYHPQKEVRGCYNTTTGKGKNFTKKKSKAERRGGKEK